MLSSGLVACSDIAGPYRDTDLLIQTEALAYELEFDGYWLGVDIPYEFHNRTGADVYLLVNCSGQYWIRVERLSGGQWVNAWQPDLDLCGFGPQTIEEGSVYADTLHLWGHAPRTNAGPQFDRVDPSGIYRVVWPGVVSSYQNRTEGPVIPHEFRVSNRFRLTCRRIGTRGLPGSVFPSCFPSQM